MIIRDLTLTINGNKGTLNQPVYLYKGDGGICLCVAVKQVKFEFGSAMAHNDAIEFAHSGEVFIKKPNGQLANIVPKTEIVNNRVHVYIEKDWVDEQAEIGIHKLQIVLYDESGDSRITLPPFNFEVIAPLEEDLAVATDLLTEDGIALLSENGNGIRISELPSNSNR